MDRGIGSGVWGLGGLVLGYVAGRWNHCGGYGYGGGCGGYGPGYPGGYGPGYPGGYGPGYGYGCDRPRHEDRQDERLACLEAEAAANRVAIKKDEKIAFHEDKIIKEELEGKIFKATCMKPDGRVYLQPNHLADPYNSEPRFIDAHGFRDGFREGREGREERCCNGFRNNLW